MSGALLSIEGLRLGFDGDDGFVPVIDDLSLSLKAGETLALVGESGCGKSLTALSILKLLPPFGRINGGRIRLGDLILNELPERALSSVRGNRISMIFQEPMSALNPVFTVGRQISEAVTLHQRLDRAAAQRVTLEMLDAVGIPNPAARAECYPHELSGGMRQRVMIAIALACRPDVLIADEPTTALDVTIQAQIMDLMLDLQAELNTAILFISHDFGVVSHMADRIAVMYAGRIVEEGDAAAIIEGAAHPYTQALLATTPRLHEHRERLPAIEGRVPAPLERPAGCCFAPRCARAQAHCLQQAPPERRLATSHLAVCHEVSDA